MWQWFDTGKQEASGKEKISFIFEGFLRDCKSPGMLRCGSGLTS